jgi:hypothetical protein
MKNQMTTSVPSVPLAKRVVKPLLFSLLLLTLPSFVGAQMHYEVTPSISVSETYDDNIDLTKENKKSDYITEVSPGITLNMRSEKSNLALTYAPGFVWYAKNDGNNTVRQSGSLAYQQAVAEKLSFDFSDTYLRSEDPLEQTEGITSVRRTRNPYQRNSARASMSYLLGLESRLTAGYRNDLLINEDPAIDDSMTHNPFADLAYWFNNTHGMGLSYAYTQVDSSQDEEATALQRLGSGSLLESDYSSHAPGVRYLHRFSPVATGFVGYTLTTTTFDTGLREDYDVHHGTVGLDKQFSAKTSLAASVGYFVRDGERSGTDGAPSYSVALTQRFQRGSFVVGGDGGWREQSMEAENRGFVEYYSGFARVNYQFLEALSGYVGITYYQDKDRLDGTRKTWRSNCGLRWGFHRYLSLGLEYTYANESSNGITLLGREFDAVGNDYDTNRVMLTLTGSKPYRW